MKRCMMITVAILFTVVGGAGCMSSESKVLEKLEEKYDQKFFIEGVKEGSKMFSQMYGKDKLTVHPEGNPEVVFLAQEDSDDKGIVNDNYVLAKWAEELKAKLADQIEKELPSGTPYKVLLRIAPDKYDKSMVNMSFDEYLEKGNKDFTVVLKAGIKTDGKPDVSEYNKNIYNLFYLIKNIGSTGYSVSIGFADKSEDISDYIRTSYVNNIAWSNLKAKVYGDVSIDERFDPETNSGMVVESLLLTGPERIAANYEPIGDR